MLKSVEINTGKSAEACKRGGKKGTRMGHIIRGHTIVASILILAFLVISGRKVVVRICMPQSFDVQFDATFSDKSKNEIIHFVESLDKRMAAKVPVFVSILKERFPHIQSLQVRLIPPGIMKISCKASKPDCIINEKLALISEKSMCPIDYFQDHVCSGLPRITIEQSLLANYDAKAIKVVVNQISSDIFAQYRIVLCNQADLIFEDKQQPFLSLICRADKVPTRDLCIYGTYIKELLISRDAFSGKFAAHYQADLRFEKQIILSKK